MTSRAIVLDIQVDIRFLMATPGHFRVNWDNLEQFQCIPIFSNSKIQASMKESLLISIVIPENQKIIPEKQKTKPAEKNRTQDWKIFRYFFNKHICIIFYL